MGFSFDAQTALRHSSTPGAYLRKARTLCPVLAFLGATLGAAAGELQLSWVDNSSNESGFEIERSVDGASFELLATVEADVASFSDGAVVPGLPYYYRVRAYNDFGFSGYTNVSLGSAPNTAPVVSSFENYSILRGESAESVAFQYSDQETASDQLATEVISSNPELLPLDRIGLTTEGGIGSITLDPMDSVLGSSVVTVLVSDGAETVESSFVFEVLRNAAPTLGALAAKETFAGMLAGPYAFTVSDTESDASELSVTATSQDGAKIDPSSIEVLGSGSERTVRFRSVEGATGSATVVLTVSDGVNQTSGALAVSILSNAAPVIAGLQSEYVVAAGGSLRDLGFTISDLETAPGSLSVSVASTNPTLLPPGSVVVRGTGSSRLLDIVPASRQYGLATITVVVSDGGRSTKHEAVLRVLPPELEVNLIDFRVKDGFAIAEVEKLPGANFTLWKTHSLRDATWEQVNDVEIVDDVESLLLIDPNPVEAVFYQVVATL